MFCLLFFARAAIAFRSSGAKRTGTILPFASPFGSFGRPTFLDFFCWLKTSKLLNDCNFAEIKYSKSRSSVNSDSKPDEQRPKSNGPTPAKATQGNTAPVTQPATAEQFQEVKERMTAFERSTVRWARVAVGISILVRLTT